MNNKKGFSTLEVIVLAVIILAIGGGVYYWQNQKNNSATEPLAGENKNIYTKCFKQIFSDNSIISAKFTFAENSVEGPLSYLWAQKDNSIGIFKGMLKEGLIVGDYTFMSEGQESLGKSAFRYDGKSLIQGFGPNLDEFSGAVTLNEVPCE
ncbi:MAG: hypothetical protein PHN74_00205 [Candidatus Pacebacteria bacterium]|nr:hypothetical protein [Candidatus Paceibacterota bacterium]